MTVLADPGLAHQIVIRVGQPSEGLGGRLVISCNCQRLPPRPGHSGHRPIEARPRWDNGEALEAWHRWHQEQGIAL